MKLYTAFTRTRFTETFAVIGWMKWVDDHLVRCEEHEATLVVGVLATPPDADKAPFGTVADLADATPVDTPVDVQLVNSHAQRAFGWCL